jgi:hypothetical protein
MTRFVIPDGVRTRAAPLFVLVSVLAAGGCSSWDTGTTNDRAPELACLDLCEGFSRAAERCGLEYKRAHDDVLKVVANGDCQNITGVRDEASFRKVCIPSLTTETCNRITAAAEAFARGNGAELHPTCSTQLQRSL